MDTKFRKLISRLSLKEKNKSHNNGQSEPAGESHKDKKSNVIVVDDSVGGGSEEDSDSSDFSLAENNRIFSKILLSKDHLVNTIVANNNCQGESDKSRDEEEGLIVTRNSFGTTATMLSIDTNNHLLMNDNGGNKNDNNEICDESLYSNPIPNGIVMSKAGLLTQTQHEISSAMDILTQVQFSCPTLLRKSKKRALLHGVNHVNDGNPNSVHIIYEELKPQLAAKPRLYLKKGASTATTLDPLLLNNEIIGPEIQQQQQQEPLLLFDDNNNQATMEQENPDHGRQVILEINIEKSEDEEDNISQISSASSALSTCPNSTTPATTTGESSESSAEDNDRPHVVEDDNDNDNSLYVNLQELEISRRQLIAAQVVKAKFAENWIDGENVIEDSILSNKEKTKQYWEVRLRKDQDEKKKIATKKGLNNSLSSSSVIQKMNAEIEELHRREKELKRPNGKLMKSSDDEEEDIFSSNGSSVDGFEPSESPRLLESGFYSNVGEDELIITSPELIKPESDKASSKKLSAKIEPTMGITISNGESNYNEYNSSDEIDDFKEHEQQLKETYRHVQQNEDDEEPAFHIANYRKETPIDREIRLAHEREQEYKMRRLSTASVDSQQPLPIIAHVTVATESSSPPPKPVSFSSTRNIFESREAGKADRNHMKNIQYVLATDRLKKEILETKIREEELKSRGKLQNTLQVEVETIPVSDQNGSRSSSISDMNDIQEEVIPEPIPEPVAKPFVEPPKNSTIESAVEFKYSKPMLSPTPPSPTTATPPPNNPQQYSFLTRPKFNSIERYLIKSSLQLRLGTNFIGKQEPEVKVEEVVNKEAAIVEEDEEVVADEPIAPRRRLVSTQHRIAVELKEMREREKELALTRKYKSTSDLTAISSSTMMAMSPVTPNRQHDDDVFSENFTTMNGGADIEGSPEDTPEIEETRIPETRNYTSGGVGKERRKSALISQWEEMIHGGADKF